VINAFSDESCFRFVLLTHGRRAVGNSALWMTSLDRWVRALDQRPSQRSHRPLSTTLFALLLCRSLSDTNLREPCFAVDSGLSTGVRQRTAFRISLDAKSPRHSSKDRGRVMVRHRLLFQNDPLLNVYLSFPDDLFRVFVIAKRNEFGVSQMVSTGPLQKSYLSWMGLFLPGEPRVRMSFGSSLVPKRAS
jgi:hypothetical protein